MVTGIENFKEWFKENGDQYVIIGGTACDILMTDAVLTPLSMDDDISSLSAILLDEDYYEFLKQGKVTVAGVTVLDAAYLIPFKAKAWIDLTDRKTGGEHVDIKQLGLTGRTKEQILEEIEGMYTLQS